MTRKNSIVAPSESIWQLLHGRFRPVWTTGLLYLAIACTLRVVLWAAFGRHFEIPILRLPELLVLGAVNDLMVLPPLLLPLSLLLLFAPVWKNASMLRRGLAHLFSFLFIFGLIYLAFTQYFFFDEFNSRFNLVAVNYLVYPYEVFVNIWQSYHVLWFLLTTGLVACLIQISQASWLVRPQMVRASFRSRLKFVGLQSVLVVLVLVFFSTDTLALFSNRVANEIAANGISSFFRALHTNELDYNQYYRTIERSAAFSILQKELRLKDQQPATSFEDLNRTFPGYSEGLGKLNIVIVVEESFGAQFVGSYGDTRGLTPCFDRLSRHGMLFANAYASGTRTVRGLAAIVTSLPPIPSEGIMKRPGSEHMANWGTVLQRQGYQTSFLYGGHGFFDNMNHFFSSNGFAISDLAEIKEITHRNIWGVCDEDLFRHAMHYYAKSAEAGRPFFSVIMTTSNHQPYTFPENIPDVPVSGGGRLAGVRYADYALGWFIDQAETTSWGKNTLFIVVADHDARVYGSELVPMRHYRIPLLMLAPDHLKPQLVQTRIGQMDIAPTVMGILGMPFSAPFYGQDVLHWPAGRERPILINHGRDVALLVGKKLAVLGLHKSVSVFDYDGRSHDMHRSAVDPALVDLATAYYQTAFDLFESHRYVLPPVAD
jgi:phosphoglycerol transferase MdoB-like AlkP superfamily enzyme